MIVPTIHINGTSRDELLRGYCDAIEAIDKAIEALRVTAPHGRDYYPQGDEALRDARNAHEARTLKLHLVQEELEQIAGAIV